MAHHFDLRVYYEDTDLAGIVYYANYLKFLERGRTEALRALGVDQGALRAETGQVFAVRRVEIDYRRPALFDDALTVRTALLRLGGASVTLDQAVLRGAAPLVTAQVVVALVGADGRPARLSPLLRAQLSALEEAPPGSAAPR